MDVWGVIEPVNRPVQYIEARSQNCKKATIIFVTAVRMERLGPYWTIFMKFDI
jgi:hypothetical protein